MRKLTAVAATLLLFTTYREVKAQVDPHFTQYYMYPGWLNPGLTGAFSGDYRVTGIYRNQWSGITNPFSTPGISADVNTGKNISIGLNALNQVAGSGGYNYLNSYLSVAYSGIRFGLNKEQVVSFGFSGGILNRKFNPGKFTYGSQWSGLGYDPTAPGNETLTKTAAMAADLGAGVVYYDSSPDKRINPFVGFSAFHLNQPEDPFLGTGFKSKLPVRYTFHGGARIFLSEIVSAVPNLLYMKQGNAEEKMVGGYFQFIVNDVTDFMVGANYRLKDAVAPYVGVFYNGFVLSASYDVNVSDLGSTAGTMKAGNFEIALSFTAPRTEKLSKAYFSCPRL
jgi:type IX secretion system PorP/SprF family membrane protein